MWSGFNDQENISPIYHDHGICTFPKTADNFSVLFPTGETPFSYLGICTFPKANEPGKIFLHFEWETHALSYLHFPKICTSHFLGVSLLGKRRYASALFPFSISALSQKSVLLSCISALSQKNIALNLRFPRKEAQKKTAYLRFVVENRDRETSD